MQEEKCGVECGQKVPGLLFADDTCLLAPDESRLKKSLHVLVEWCKELGVKINVAKCGIMHICKKNVARCTVKYEVRQSRWSHHMNTLSDIQEINIRQPLMLY